MGLSVVVIFLVLTYLLSYLALKPLFEDWETPYYDERRAKMDPRFSRLRGWWDYIFLGSGVVGILCTLVVNLKVGDLWFPELMFGLLGFYFTFMAVTDFFTQKAPFDVQDLALAVVAPIGILGVVFNLYQPKNYLRIDYVNSQVDDLWQIGPFLVLVLVFALLWYRGILKGMGFGDIVVLGIATLGMGGLIGLQHMAYALLAAALLQMVAFIGAHIWGWGTLVPTPYSRSRTVVNDIWQRVTGSTQELLGSTSRQLAWLPMICVGYLGVGLITL